MKSMTGYGYAETTAAGPGDSFRMSLEIKSYNNRYLDIYVNLPAALSVLEPRIREYIGGRVLRGKVEVFLKVKNLRQNLNISFDPAVASGYLAALKSLAELAGTGERVGLSQLLQMEGILTAEDSRGTEDYGREMERLLENAFAAFEESRLREGEATQKDILALLEEIKKNAAATEACAPEIEEYFTRVIRGRMEELLAGEADRERIAAEVAMLLVRYSIHEELVRLDAHCEAFLAAASEKGGIGRKLDFICQELNREVNTLGSKNILANVSRHVVAMKDSLENIREQIRNIE